MAYHAHHVGQPESEAAPSKAAGGHTETGVPPDPQDVTAGLIRPDIADRNLYRCRSAIENCNIPAIVDRKKLQSLLLQEIPKFLRNRPGDSCHGGQGKGVDLFHGIDHKAGRSREIG